MDAQLEAKIECMSRKLDAFAKMSAVMRCQPFFVPQSVSGLAIFRAPISGNFQAATSTPWTLHSAERMGLSTPASSPIRR